MRRLSPSSRLVLVTVVLAFVVLLAVGSTRPAPASSPPPLAAAGGSALASAGPSASPAPSGSAEVAGEPSASLLSTVGVTATPAVTPAPTTRSQTSVAGCAPTDQDRYVYHPSRLEVLRPCIRVTGTVAAVRIEADGDLHILLDLDAPYRSLLRPSNQGEELGDLVVEPVCVAGVTQADAIDVCATDPDPLQGPPPVVGERVWMEGRYVLDLDHDNWAELHPLYRWGRG